MSSTNTQSITSLPQITIFGIKISDIAFKVSVLIITSLAVLTSAASCTLIPSFLNNKKDISYGLVKKDPGVRTTFGKINAVKTLNDSTNSEGLLQSSIVEIAQITPQNLFALTANQGLYETNNGGRAWERKYIFPVGSSANNTEARNNELNAQIAQNNSIQNTDVEFSSRNPNLIFVAGTKDKVGKIWRSEDGGREFEEVHSEIGSGNTITGVAIDGKNDNIVYALLSEGIVIRSSDAGKTWTKIKDFQTKTIQLNVVPEYDNLLFVLLENQGFRYSRDNGTTWQEIELNREQSKVGESQTKDFTLRTDALNKTKFGRYSKLIEVPGSTTAWVMIADQQIWYTDSLDKPFIKFVLPITQEKYNKATVAIDPIQGIQRVLVSVDNNLFETTNKGVSWTTNDSIGLNSEIGDISDIEIDKENPNIIYMGLTK
jgi:photosystem II stability/assembly factor-like uncharacterized protein